jgi:3-methyl-2-oxobutanoate hydroxymethyltransferase
MKQKGEKIACLTVYDASFAQLLEDAGIEVLLVGDSLGMVIQGWETTVPVTLEDMVYHTRCVARGRKRALLVVDLPFMSYATAPLALASATALMQAGAQVVKLEGGAIEVDIVRHLTERGIPVCAHLGLTPQSVHKLGGYRVQGREETAAETIRQDALALQTAGADMLVLECVPSSLATEITHTLAIPVIGIGAGVDCDGQVLVLYDALGITPGKVPKFAKNFSKEVSGGVRMTLEAFVKAVKSGDFPTLEHRFD